MSTSSMKGAIAVACWLTVTASGAAAFETDEHRLLADSVFAVVIAELEPAKRDSRAFLPAPVAAIRFERHLWQGKSFGEICAQFGGDDLARSRFQWRGKTVLQQLRPLTAALIAQVWREHEAAYHSGPEMRSAERSDHNVVANYLLHHTLALHFAALAGAQQKQPEAALRQALIYEAMAQSFLADAFSAGHLFVPASAAFFGLNRINNERAHDFFGNEGAYVINSRGEVWQTFGDKLLHWYAPTYRAVFAAGVASLREIFFVYYAATGTAVMPRRLQAWGQTFAAETSAQALVSGARIAQDGEKYYTTIKLPALQLLPMPVAASWSVRTDSIDAHGIHHRRHYPQLREPQYHDPDREGLDEEFLYPQSAIPSTMIPPVLQSQSPAEAIKSNPEVASVRYLQQRNFPPSYVGLLLSFEGGVKLKASKENLTAALGVGYGFADDWLIFKKAGTLMTISSYDSRRLLLSPAVGLSFKTRLPGGVIEACHFEGGYVWGLRSPFKAHGFKIAAGVESPTLPLKFTYAGVTIRLKYQAMVLEKMWRGVFLELVLH